MDTKFCTAKRSELCEKLVAAATRVQTGPMISHYTILMVDARNEVIGSVYCHVRTDDAALAAAQAWLGRHACVEVWKGTRLVATLGAAAGSAPQRASAAYETNDCPRFEPDLHPPAA